jgi:immune inhibitor A
MALSFGIIMVFFIRTVLLLLSVLYMPFVMATTLMATTEFELKLSDGNVIDVRSAGNAKSQWLVTSYGQAIVKRSGYWYLAAINSQQQALSTGVPLAGGNVIAAEQLPLQMFNLSNVQLNSFSASSGASQSASVATQSFALSASSEPVQQPILLLRVSFSDQDFSHSVESFRQLMFAEKGSQYLSVAQYYRDNSYQKFNLQPAEESHGTVNDGVVDILLPYSHPNFGSNYGGPSQNLVRDALREANRHIDFSQFDNNHDGQLSPRELGVVLMIAGYENAYGGAGATEPNVWAHKSEVLGLALDGVNLSAYAMFGEQHQDHLATIGIISHEMAHLLFSLPDLYDRQGDSNGVGRWGLMGLGSWNSHQGASGNSPAHMLAWSKVKAGFVHPQDVEGDAIEFSLSPTTHGDEAMRVWLDPFRHGEHFLLEYRVREGFDRGLPGEGLLISHIDDWVGYGVSGAQNDVAEHKLVDIEEADGRSDLDLLENRGDRLDVYNDAYGQDYFGAASLPASLDYQGNSSGVEISQIQVGDEVGGSLTLPYAQLGDNLGYDDGGIGGPWGSAGDSSLIEYQVPLDMAYIHGVDIFSHTNAEMIASVFSSFHNGEVSNALFVSRSVMLTPGWNRIEFSQRVDISEFPRIYLEVKASNEAVRAFSVDTLGEASKLSYVKSGSGYQLASFDFNQRLLVAGQTEAFSYQVPDKLPLANVNKSKSSGGSLGFFIIFLFGISFVRIRLGGKAQPDL